MEQSLDGWPQADENPDADPEWSIRQVRRVVIEQDLNAKMAELALLTEQAGLPQRSLPSREARQAPIIRESHESIAEAPPPARKRRHRAGNLRLVESTRPASEIAALDPMPPDAMPEEGRVGNEARALEEVAFERDLAIATAEAEEGSEQTQAQMGFATSGSEPAVEPPRVAMGQAEAPYDAEQTRRRTVTVLTGGLLALAAIGVLFAWMGGVPGVLWPDSTFAVNVMTVVVPPIDEGQLEPEDGGGAFQPVSIAEAGGQSSSEEGLEPGPDSIAPREGDSGLGATTAAASESPPVGLTATIDTPGFVGVNLRRAPSTSAAAIEVIPTGARVELLDGRVEDEGMGWQQIRAPDGETGWVVSVTIQR